MEFAIFLCYLLHLGGRRFRCRFADNARCYPNEGTPTTWALES